MAVAKDSSYTPRTLLALGALMDVSKTDLDRAKTKTVKIFPAGRISTSTPAVPLQNVLRCMLTPT